MYEWPHLQSRKPSIHFASKKAHFNSGTVHWVIPTLEFLNFILQKFSLPVVASKEKFELGNACSSNKAHCLPFQRLTLSSNVPLQIIFSDLWDHHPFCHSTKNYITAFWLTNTPNILGCIHLKIKVRLRQYSKVSSFNRKFLQRKLSSLYTDGGGEFIGLQLYLERHGIEPLISPPTHHNVLL